jgi:GT2 family glycosyltransferase/glycosyltransferase involved in cell wall biosynthesis
VETDEGVGRLAIQWERRASEIALNASDAPLVSVLVPTLNHSADVIKCLESISRSGDQTPLEVILIDDGSDQLHHHRFQGISNIRLLRNTENLGFLDSCLAGVEAARGKYLYFLNNDTEVLPGWLDEQVGFAEEGGDSIGLIGGLVLRPDLRLQEAGCLVFQNGGCAQYGNGQIPLLPQYQQARRIDYASGCALLVTRDAWDAVGGFDRQFAPAYYEDTDLAQAIRAAGYSCWFNPGGAIIHAEGTTHGAGSSSVKDWQMFVNRIHFIEKWGEHLSEQSLPGCEYDQVFCDQIQLADDKKCVLVMDDLIPRPQHDSGSVRMAWVLRNLAAGGRTVIFAHREWNYSQRFVRDMKDLDIYFLPYTTNFDQFHGLLEKWRDRIEFVLASRPANVLLVLDPLNRFAPEIPLVYDSVDSHLLRLKRQYELDPSIEVYDSMIAAERAERTASAASDVIVYLSEADRESFVSMASSTVEFVKIGNIHLPMKSVAGSESRGGLIFVGNFQHPPNTDGIIWFVSEVLPILNSMLGPTPLKVVGSWATPEVLELGSEQVEILGWVDDLEPLYAASRVAIAPLRFGAGVKGKIGESLSHGVPTVTTSIGAEGMNLRDGVDIFVRDSAESFASAIGLLFNDDGAWVEMSKAGIRAIDEEFGERAGRRGLHELVDAVDRVRMRRKSLIL